MGRWGAKVGRWIGCDGNSAGGEGYRLRHRQNQRLHRPRCRCYIRICKTESNDSTCSYREKWEEGIEESKGEGDESCKWWVGSGPLNCHCSTFSRYPPSQKISQASSGSHSLARLPSSPRWRSRDAQILWIQRGPSLQPLAEDEVNAKLKRHTWNAMQEKWWTVEYSKKYKSMTKAFMPETVLSGGVSVQRDGFHETNMFWQKLLGPWHTDTILQSIVIEKGLHFCYIRQAFQNTHKQQLDFIERALFTAFLQSSLVLLISQADSTAWTLTALRTGHFFWLSIVR